MKNVLGLLLLAILLIRCDSNEQIFPCSTPAIIRDLTGLDGCGFVFELEDGSRIEPIIPFLECATPPLPKEITEDPLYDFEFVDGKHVRISYEEVGGVSTCMVGSIVKITCIERVAAPIED